MKLTEMQTELENLQVKLHVAYETLLAVNSSLNFGILRAEQVEFVMSSVENELQTAIKDADVIIEEVIKTRKVLEKI